MENPMKKWMIWGYHDFWKHPYGVTHLLFSSSCNWIGAFFEPVTSSTNNAPNTSSPKRYHKGYSCTWVLMEGGLHFLKVSPEWQRLILWRDPIIGTLTPPYPYILSTIYHWHKPSKKTFNKPTHDYFIGIRTYTGNFAFRNPATSLIQLNVWLPQAPDSAVCSANWKIFCLGSTVQHVQHKRSIPGISSHFLKYGEPSGKPTYPTTGKGKSSDHNWLFRGYWDVHGT